MEFVCKVGTPAGEVVEQTFSADDERALRHDLEQRGYYLFAVQRQLGVSGLGLARKAITTEQLLIFGQQLAALLKAGLPLLQSIEIMLERQQDPVFRRSLETIRDKIKSGVALSDAFKQEGDLYPPILGASLVAGERSGALETVLRRFVTYLRLNQSLKKKAVSAAVYPAMLFGMMTVLVAVMLLKVIPQFQEFYSGLNVKLPAPTRVLMGFAALLRTQLPLVVVVLAGLIAAFVAWRRRPGSGIVIDRALLRVPYLGHLMRMYATSQLSRTLATLLSGGLPLVNAMEVASASIGNRALGAAVTSATPAIREGKSLTVALEATGMLENLALEMVKVGEQTGALADMLTAIADFYDEDLDSKLATLVALIEPIMLIIMAIIVAGMLLAFYLPLFEAISAVEKNF